MKIRNPLEIHGGTKQANKTLYEMFPKYFMHPRVITKGLIELGYDGVVIYAGQGPIYQEGEIFEAVAFNKEQIIIDEKEESHI